MSELLEDFKIPYKVCKVDNCGLRVKVQVHGYGSRYAVLYLLTKECPHDEVYKITLGRLTKIESRGRYPVIQDFNEIDWSIFNEFFISWYGSVIRIGLMGNQNILEFNQERKFSPTIIGFAKFITMAEEASSELCISDWMFERPLKTVNLPRSIKIDDRLQWRSFRDYDKLPPNALIGGFQNDPIYIARARHRGSVCPGKFVPSEECASIAWGGNEYKKHNFEILCGLDAQWVKCKGKDIPENAFVGGTSEVYNEPLYIGRARVGSDLICGKVHMLYGTCYVPHNGKELEYQSYEILVTSDITPRSIQDSQCFCDKY